MTGEQNSLQVNNSQLAQSIINEMQAQGFLDGFIDEKTGETMLEIQFADQSMVCKVDAGKSGQE